MIDVVEILTHWYAGRSQNELATSLGVDRETLRKYTAPAVAAGMAPGGPPMAEADWRKLTTEWFPTLVDHRLRQVSLLLIDPHRDYIAEQLDAGVTVATIHQRLRDEQGLDASVASVRRWVRANLPEQARRAQVRVLGDGSPPGEQDLWGSRMLRMPLTSSVDAHQLSGMIFAVSLRLLYVIFQHTLGLLLLMGAPPPADFADDQSPGALSRRSGVLGLVERVRHVSGCC